MRIPGRKARAAPISTLGLIVVLVMLAVCMVIDAQPAGDARRIGYLSNTSLAGSAYLLDAFRQGLREFGWVEGQNIAIEYRWAEGRSDRLPGLADELVRLKVDVIVAPGTPSALAAKNATRAIPIVMVSAADPDRIGLIASLARPGGNLTGTSFDVGLKVFAKQLELLKEALPKMRLVAVLLNSGNPAQEIAVGNLKAAARTLGVQLHLLPVSGPNEFDRAFGVMRSKHADALLVAADAMLNLHRARLANLAVQNRLPSMYGFREFVQSGGFMSYGPSLTDIARRAATFVDKILKGAKPADLPVEQPTRFELVINLRTAKTLGLSVPQPLLSRADEVVE
jgi:putative ABC transport system substrate-binding protein